MTQDPNAKARELFDGLYAQWTTFGGPKPSELDPRSVEVIAAAITEARAEALEEAARVAEYWCDEGYHGEHCANDCSAARIRALKEKA